MERPDFTSLERDVSRLVRATSLMSFDGRIRALSRRAQAWSAVSARRWRAANWALDIVTERETMDSLRAYVKGSK